jgi:hypothetical protein
MSPSGSQGSSEAWENACGTTPRSRLRVEVEEDRADGELDSSAGALRSGFAQESTDFLGHGHVRSMERSWSFGSRQELQPCQVKGR